MNPKTARQVGRKPHGSSDDPERLDFSANINPRVPNGAREVYENAFDAARTYPAEPPMEYRTAAAEYVNCESETVTPTPGGLAAIRQTIDLAVGPDDSVLLPFPSFAEYAREVQLHGGNPVFVPHDEILTADPTKHALAVICNPNNPTGDAYDPGNLEGFATECRRSDTTLLVDEAFLGFTDRPSLAGTDGVVVARSLTKLFGFPGLRAGFAVATDDFGDALRSSRRTWNLGVPALMIGAFCMAQDEFVAATRERVHTERERMRSTLSERFEVHPSDAPFLLFDAGDEHEIVLNRAREQRLALRDATTFRGLDSHIRVAVRLPGENDRLLEALGV